MDKRKITSLLLLITGLALSIAFFLKIDFPQGLETYFKREYYRQFGPLVLSVELLIASYYLLKGDDKVNFTLALFGFTALLDPVFNQLGLLNSIVPLYGTIILLICGLICLWIAFSNTFKLKRLSPIAAILSGILGAFVELFFNFP